MTVETRLRRQRKSALARLQLLLNAATKLVYLVLVVAAFSQGWL